MRVTQRTQGSSGQPVNGSRSVGTNDVPGPTSNHIIAARQEFSGVFADLARGKRNWQLVAFGATAALVLVAAADARLAASARVVPYVIEVDRFGQVAATGTAERMATPSDRLVSSQLAQFVRDVRTVLPAAASAAQAELIRRAYAFAAPEAAAFLNDHFSDPRHDPRVLGSRLTRQVDVTGLLRVPHADVWRLRWTETELSTQGDAPTRKTGWEGYLTVKLVPPVSMETVQLNPLGVYVTSISWTQIADTTFAPGAADAHRDTGGTP